MPRASYGDKHTVSVMQGSNHTVFDFTSRVIDFIAITRGDEDDTEESRAGKKNDTVYGLLCLPSTWHVKTRCTNFGPVSSFLWANRQMGFSLMSKFETQSYNIFRFY